MRRQAAQKISLLYASTVFIAALAAALVGATILFAVRSQSDNDWVQHTLGLRNDISRVMRNVQAAETSQRGYLLTGRENYLEAYGKAVAALPSILEEIAAMSSDNFRQQQAISQLRLLVDEKLNEIRSTIEKLEGGDKKAALAIFNTDEGFRLMDEIRRIVTGLEEQENQLLATRQANAAESAVLLRNFATAGLGLICIVGVLTIHAFRRSFYQLAAANHSLALSNEALIMEAHRRAVAEDKLRQAHKMEAIGQLTGGIAHDFNNMLAVIQGSLALMRRRVLKDDTRTALLMDEAEKATERSITLTQRLLAFSRRQPLAPEKIECERLVENLRVLLQTTLGEHIIIKTILPAELWTIFVDANELENAILNVSINARDAMPNGGSLTIEAANAPLDEHYCNQYAEVEPGEFVMIAISDTGSGMTPEVLARAFDPFYTTKPVGKGTGLGLSQVYGFVKQSCGHVKIYSEAGVGTTVKIYLPRAVSGDRRLTKNTPSPKESQGNGQSILIVEDEPLMLHITSEAMRELGYTVHSSDSASNALDILDRTPQIELLFTDVVMPDLNGKELADEALRRRPDLKIVFATGYTSNAVVHGGILDSNVNFLSKPFTLEQLASMLRYVLAEAP